MFVTLIVTSVPVSDSANQLLQEMSSQVTHAHSEVCWRAVKGKR